MDAMSAELATNKRLYLLLRTALLLLTIRTVDVPLYTCIRVCFAHHYVGWFGGRLAEQRRDGGGRRRG